MYKCESILTVINGFVLCNKNMVEYQKQKSDLVAESEILILTKTT